jgi:hypothetical protein
MLLTWLENLTGVLAHSRLGRRRVTLVPAGSRGQGRPLCYYTESLEPIGGFLGE